MLRIAICDDEKEICKQIEQYISEYSRDCKMFMDTQIYLSGEALIKALDQGEQFTLLFLDIEMNQIDGVNVGKYIRNKLDNQKMQIVFVSGRETYYRLLFESRPQNFILKPFTKEQIIHEIEKTEKIIHTTDGVFSFMSKGVSYKILYSQIKCFTSNNRCVQVIATDATYRFYGKLNELDFLKQQGFIRTHNSFLVNCLYVKSWGPTCIVLTDGFEIPISRAYKAAVQKDMLKGKG